MVFSLLLKLFSLAIPSFFAAAVVISCQKEKPITIFILLHKLMQEHLGLASNPACWGILALESKDLVKEVGSLGC